MKKELQNIISGIGLGHIKFGISREQIEVLLGEPDEVEETDLGEESLSETWHYDELEVSMSFDQDEDWKLVAISVSSDFYEFEGLKLIGLTTTDFLAQLQEIGVEDVELEDSMTEDKVLFEHYYSEDKAMSFWLEDGVVADVQWTIVFVDENTIDWPQ